MFGWSAVSHVRSTSLMPIRGNVGRFQPLYGLFSASYVIAGFDLTQEHQYPTPAFCPLERY